MEYNDKDDRLWEQGRSGGQLMTPEQLAMLSTFKPIVPYKPEPVKQRKTRRSRSQWATNSRVPTN
jgi:hypothetical protein